MLSELQLQVIHDILDANGKIGKAWLFGSFARNQETAKSDIDILFSFKKGNSFGLLEMLNLVSKLESALHRKVDLVHEGSLLSFAVESAERDRILIFEK